MQHGTVSLFLVAFCLSVAGLGTVGVRPAAAAQTPSAPSINQSEGAMVVGKQHTLHITATGYPKATFTESGALPTGVSFQATNGSAMLTGTPAPGTGNDYNITLTATNSAGTDSDEPYDLEVVQLPDYPSGFCPGDMTVGKYVHLDQTVAAYPADFGLDLNNTPPDGIQFNQDNNNEDLGYTSGIPQPGSGGRYHLQYSADESPNVGNGKGTTKNYSCPVIVNEAPTFTDGGTTTITAGTKLTSPLDIGGTTGYPRTITVTSTGTLPSGLTGHFKQSAKAFGDLLRGTPAAGSEGDYALDVTGDNGVKSTEDFILIVQAPGASPPAHHTHPGIFHDHSSGHVRREQVDLHGARERQRNLPAHRLRAVLARGGYHDRAGEERRSEFHHPVRPRRG